jgi:alkyl hydroperoxide reductase subunit F
MLDATLKTQLAAYLEKLQLPIELNAALDASNHNSISHIA